jgi:hypothetical protein
LALLVVFAAVTSAVAQPAGGMAAEQYFVGTWACKATLAGGPALDISITFVMDSGILREWDEVRIPGVAVPYTISKSISYDARNNRWVQAQTGSDGSWNVSYAKPWTGNTQEWLGVAATDDKLSRNETTRTGANEFGFRNYTNPADAKPSLEGTCTRSK